MIFEFKIGTFVMISIKCRIFSLINVLICLLNHGGSLLSHKTVWNIWNKISNNFKSMLGENINFFIEMLVFKKTLCQLNFPFALFMSPVWTSL